MSIHQLVTASPGKIAYRDVSCFCDKDREFMCDCFTVKHFTFNNMDDEPMDENACHSTAIIYSPQLVGRWCIVKYDKKPFPGNIEDLDENDLYVKCMHYVGKNRFFWPEPVQDRCWYSYDDVVMLIEPPTKIGSRHWELSSGVYNTIADHLD